eukprot:2736767-Pyramimonas_sp.AAC.1
MPYRCLNTRRACTLNPSTALTALLHIIRLLTRNDGTSSSDNVSHPCSGGDNRAYHFWSSLDKDLYAGSLSNRRAMRTIIALWFSSHVSVMNVGKPYAVRTLFVIDLARRRISCVPAMSFDTAVTLYNNRRASTLRPGA